MGNKEAKTEALVVTQGHGSGHAFLLLVSSLARHSSLLLIPLFPFISLSVFLPPSSPSCQPYLLLLFPSSLASIISNFFLVLFPSVPFSFSPSSVHYL